MSAQPVQTCGIPRFVHARDALANAITSGQRGKWRTLGPQWCEHCMWWHIGERLAASDAGMRDDDIA